VYYIIRKNLGRTNRETLLLGGILAFCVPIANGIITQKWIWKTLINRQTDLLVVDFLWLTIAIICLIAYSKTRDFMKTISSKEAIVK
jgi:hypothetical protein